jgi:hypothetical protein
MASDVKLILDSLKKVGEAFSQKYGESATGNPLYDSLEAISGLFGEKFQSFTQPVLGVIKEAIVYKDGISETRFGADMEKSWAGASTSFISGVFNRTVRLSGYTIRFSESTPFDPSADSNTSLYGNLMLGTPMIYTKITDPNNRVMLNTFVKDSSFLSLTPGMPKFNGSSFFQGSQKVSREIIKTVSNTSFEDIQKGTSTVINNVSNYLTTTFNIDRSRGIAGNALSIIGVDSSRSFEANAINVGVNLLAGSAIVAGTILTGGSLLLGAGLIAGGVGGALGIRSFINNALRASDSQRNPTLPSSNASISTNISATNLSSSQVDAVSGVARNSLDSKTIAAYNQMVKDRQTTISTINEENRQRAATTAALNNRGTTGLSGTQGTAPSSAISYLLRNGIDSGFMEKDKRYYTFEAKYSDYYAYLETMLNTVWLKLGLGTEDEAGRNFNIFSFFNISDGQNTYDKLDERYNSSLGFYVNIASRVSESVTNQTMSAGLEEYANNSADIFQRLNYLTGMGTGGVAQNLRRGIGAGMELFSVASNQIFDKISFKNIVSNVSKMIATTDIGALTQAFSTNGMRTIYPELWGNAGYSKNIQFDFNFVSPYGDPLSIFQYVYVPFLSLLTFILPRQVRENGFVSPFFVRADVPGLVTSDLALITDISWTKGGENNLWTKDKLPRAISGSFTVTDLYPYLAMVKRLSYMSANPSYTVFLDNMAGLKALYTLIDKDAPLSNYWRQMINRVSGAGNTTIDNRLWNRFDTPNRETNAKYADTSRESIARSINRKSVKWMSKI